MVQFVAVMVPIQILVALVAALVLDTLATRLSKLSRLMIFVPYAIPAVIGALMWGFLYSPRFGPGRRHLSGSSGRRRRTSSARARCSAAWSTS